MALFAGYSDSIRIMKKCGHMAVKVTIQDDL